MKKNKIRNQMVMIWNETTASTATRDTKYNALQSAIHISDANMCICYPTAKADVIL
jgi:hypothetical protein